MDFSRDPEESEPLLILQRDSYGSDMVLGGSNFPKDLW